MTARSPSPPSPTDSTVSRRVITVRGAVQGVGFRPFVYRLATELHLTGWVLNAGQGVFIEVEGPEDALDAFCARLSEERPPQSFIQELFCEAMPPAGYLSFEIRESAGEGPKTTLVLPDIATCHECLQEVFSPLDRRYMYPFTNCTNCGPRFSIIQALPYDRPNTTMARFTMCPACQAEYDAPTDRRFHAQPNACPECGPQLALWDQRGSSLAEGTGALAAAASAIRQGLIVAVKGLGGFHLLVDARSTSAVERLRRRKQRSDKPFAVMFPSRADAARCCQLAETELRLLESPAAPIVIAHRRPESQGCSEAVSPAVAPGNPTLGVLLPYTPLHHLLLADLGFPVVATSGNLSDEPICIDEQEALERLGHVADYFLVHDRPIVRPVDDSVVQTVGGDVQMLRRSRGYAPLPVVLELPPSQRDHPPVLAVGGHLKNTVALAVGANVFLSQHLGDLETAASFEAFRQAIDSLQTLFEAEPGIIACDAHPDYPSARFAAQLAESRNLPLVKVQHHYAHALACMAEHGLRAPVLGVVWDGTGYGLDGTVWGGEFLLVTEEGFQRVAHLRPFSLAGGDRAVREPRRSALGLLYELNGGSLFEWRGLAPLDDFTWEERRILKLMLAQGLNTVRTTSAGRLFDGVAALLGLHLTSTFEGQAAMALEFAAERVAEQVEPYPFNVLQEPHGPWVLDWGPLVDGVLTDLEHGVAQDATGVGYVAARFHATLVEMIDEAARRVGAAQVVLSGGCFQNRLLTERAIERLRGANFQVYWHQQTPPNDGGIALGQVAAVMRGGDGVTR